VWPGAFRERRVVTGPGTLGVRSKIKYLNVDQESPVFLVYIQHPVQTPNTFSFFLPSLLFSLGGKGAAAVPESLSHSYRILKN
jgi:hypothetical protein